MLLETHFVLKHIIRYTYEGFYRQVLLRYTLHIQHKNIDYPEWRSVSAKDMCIAEQHRRNIVF